MWFPIILPIPPYRGPSGEPEPEPPWLVIAMFAFLWGAIIFTIISCHEITEGR